MWFIGVEVEQEKSAPPPKKNPGSAPGLYNTFNADKVISSFPPKLIPDHFGFVRGTGSELCRIVLWNFSIYTLSDLGNSSNRIG